MNHGESLHVFRVKIWLEANDSKPGEEEWRGEVRHLDTGEVVFFRRLSGFGDAVQRLGVKNDEPS